MRRLSAHLPGASAPQPWPSHTPESQSAAATQAVPGLPLAGAASTSVIGGCVTGPASAGWYDGSGLFGGGCGGLFAGQAANARSAASARSEAKVVRMRRDCSRSREDEGEGKGKGKGEVE